ncbi:hypothetical protein ABVT39_017442 [Epinephelus coioides]
MLSRCLPLTTPTVKVKIERSVTFYRSSAPSPHRVSLNKLSVDMNNVPFNRPTIVDASPLFKLPLATGLPDHRLETTPLRADWPDAGECDAEFDRLISGRGSYKGGTDGVMLPADRNDVERRALKTTHDVAVEEKQRNVVD